MIDRHAPVQTINLCQVAIPTVVESIIDESNIFTVFPNPTSGLLNIKVKGLSNEKCKITLTSILGQILIEEEFMARNHSIETQFDMKDLSNGIYFLSVTSNKIKQTFKVQKQ
ncbi:MAG: T9SS type A sorting domain-containing protein [Bacteroidetes bacterium]|nr:T9SS type A sorting domain-containing protein [Bacteroidota bacterium]